jgi:hypothetical protein
MRYVKISEEEMKKTKNVYDEVLSGTASTLLFNVGHVYCTRIKGRGCAFKVEFVGG